MLSRFVPRRPLGDSAFPVVPAYAAAVFSALLTTSPQQSTPSPKLPPASNKVHYFGQNAGIPRSTHLERNYADDRRTNMAVWS